MATFPVVLRVFSVDEDSGAQTPVGALAADEGWRLRLLRADDDVRSALEALVDQLNKKETINVKAPPPPGARRFSVYSRVVPRDRDEFLDAMNEFLGKYHDMKLEEADDDLDLPDAPSEYRDDAYREGAVPDPEPPRDLAPPFEAPGVPKDLP